jgi:hypothetical protein
MDLFICDRKHITVPLCICVKKISHKCTGARFGCRVFKRLILQYTIPKIRSLKKTGFFPYASKIRRHTFT